MDLIHVPSISLSCLKVSSYSVAVFTISRDKMLEATKSVHTASAFIPKSPIIFLESVPFESFVGLGGGTLIEHPSLFSMLLKCVGL